MLRLLHGDCLKVLPTLPDGSIDSIVTDPPYGLSAARNSGKKSKGGFMGKRWDYDVPAVAIWQECLRVLKPGGHLLCFASTRTQHRMATNIEDAGFEIRDLISWIYGSGFPKNHNIEKAIGKQLPTIDTAKIFSGWGTALKPAMELITLARKPFEGTVAANVLEYGTGGINVDGCRVDYTDEADKASATPQGTCTAKVGALAGGTQNERTRSDFERPEQRGRFPANIIFDEEAAAVLDEQTGDLGNNFRRSKANGSSSIWGSGKASPTTSPSDSGGASRFFYCAKASKKERTRSDFERPEQKGRFPANVILDEEAAAVLDEQSGIRPSGGSTTANARKVGLYKDGLKQRIIVPYTDTGGASRFFYCPKASKKDRTENKTIENKHPTVKPTKLMQYLCRLVTPVDGVVLDPFAGSGTTGKAARLEGFNFIGIELEEEYFKTAQRRLGLESE